MNWKNYYKIALIIIFSGLIIVITEFLGSGMFWGIKVAYGYGGGGGGGYYRPPVSAAVPSPTVDNFLAETTESYITISGTKAENTTVYVNGSSFGVVNPTYSTWSKAISLEMGENIINIFAKDSSGTSSETILVVINRLEPVIPTVPTIITGINYSDVFKGSGDTVYYYGIGGKRYVFPNIGTFLSWNADFSNVKQVSDTELSMVGLGSKNVTYKPGVRMLKIQSDPKVYAVASNGVLRWVTTEEIAIALYGENWASFIDDLNVAFWVDYTIGEPITDASQFNPELAANQALEFYTYDVLSPISTPVAPPVEEPLPMSIGCEKDLVFVSLLYYGLNNNEEVLALQKLLQCLNYFPADVEPNGNFGMTTEAAVVKFQNDYGLDPVGYVGPGTREELNKYPSGPCEKTMVFESYLETGTSGEEVLALQKLLQCLEYFSADVVPNGVFGPATEAAVREFQSDNDIEALGVVGPLTRAELNKY